MSSHFKHAAIAFLAQESLETAYQLTRFDAAAWASNLKWLDEAGLALYLADAMQRAGAFRLLPDAVQARFTRNLADTRSRLAWLFGEFAKLVALFDSLRKPYLVHKGFSLVPEYCRDALLRTQADLDFQILKEDAALFSCRLASAGYAMVLDADGEMAFESAPHKLARLADLYKPKDSVRIELHFTDAAEDRARCFDESTKIEWKHLYGIRFPVLDPVEQFLHQAAHTVQHIRAGWIRPSSLYEIFHFVARQPVEPQFWQSVAARCAQDSTCAADCAFTFALLRVCFSPDLPSHAVLPAAEHTDLWVRHFGQEFLLADFPGTKLQYLLSGERHAGRPAVPGMRMRTFFPVAKAFERGIAALNALARTAQPNSHEVRYFIARIAYHVRANLRLYAARKRWRRELLRRRFTPA